MVPYFNDLPSDSAMFSKRFIILAILCIIITITRILTKAVNYFRKKVRLDSKVEKGNCVIPYYSQIGLESLQGYVKMFPLLESLFLGMHIRRDGLKIIEKICQRYPEHPIFEMIFINDLVKVVKCPNLAHKLLSLSSTQILNKPRNIYKYALANAVQNGLVGMELDAWSVHRKVLNKSFTYKSLQNHLKIINKRGKRLILNLLNISSNSTKISRDELNHEIYFQTLGIISDVLFGEGIMSEVELTEFHRHLSAGKKINFERISHPINLIPMVWKLNPKKKLFDYHETEALQLNKKAVRTVMKNNRMELSGSELSIVEQMIRNHGSETEIAFEALVFIIAGHETTVTEIQFFLQHIAEHPKYQILCQKEIDDLFNSKLPKNGQNEGGNLPDNNFDTFSMSDLSSLKYLEMCILETLRLTPVIPIILRELSEPLEIDGWKFDKDTIFMFPIWAIHRDPKVFLNPEKFNPDRFLAECMEGKRQSFGFLPFSLGPRNCIGYKFAMLQMKIVLIWILRYFNVSTTDELKDIRIDPETITKPSRDYNVSLSRRVIP